MTFSTSKFILIVALSAAFCFLMSFRILEIGGISPNLFLVFSLFLLYAPRERRGDAWSAFFLSVATLLSLSFSVFGFWTHFIILLVIAVPISYSVRVFLTGHSFFDFAASLFLGMIIFYGVSALLFGAGFSFGVLFFELLYNILVGAVLWVIFRSFRIL